MQQFHAIISGYIETLKRSPKKADETFNIERLKMILDIINSESNNNDNHSFENFMLHKIYTFPDSCDEKLNLINKIYEIYDANNFDSNRIIYNMCDYVVELYKDDNLSNDEKIHIIKVLMKISENLSSEDIGIIQPNYIINSIIKMGVESEVSKEIFKHVKRNYSNTHVLYNSFLSIIDINLSEDNFADYMTIIKELMKRLYSHSCKESFINTVRLIDHILSLGPKKYYRNIDEFNGQLKETFEMCDKIIDSTCDSEIKETLFAILNENLENPNIEDKIFEYMYSVSIKSIESLNIQLTHCLSNHLGWYLFNKLDIDNYNESAFNKVTRVFNKIKKFFQLSCDYIADIEATGMFVGTIFVINLIHLELNINKYVKNNQLSNRYKRLKAVFINELQKLNDDQIDILKKSFKIRKETCEGYFSDEKDVKRICGQIEHLLFYNKIN